MLAKKYATITLVDPAAEHRIALEVVPWTARFRRLARDHERLPTTLAGLHCIAGATLMLLRVTSIFMSS